MQNNLQKLIKLAKKTGDRLIVFDSNNPEESFVLMGVNDYEKLVIQKSEVRGLTEDELLDKINRDIAIWKSEHDYQENELNSSIKYNTEKASEHIKKDEDDDRMYYYEDPSYAKVSEDKDDYMDTNEDEDLDDFDDNFLEDNENENPWKIPKKIEKQAEEII